jgi:nitrogen regulatory protein PII
MQTIKRVEIVTDSLEMQEVIEVIESIGIAGYTLIKDVLGKGERGIQSGDELTGVFKNSLLLVACEPGKVPGLVEAVRPMLKQCGGICLVSDAQWVVH